MNSLLLVQWVGFRMLFLKKQVQGLNGNLFDSGDLRKLRDFIAIYRILFQKISKNDTYFDWKSAAHDVVPSAKTKENEKLISCSKFSRKIKVFSKIIEMQQVFRYYQTTKKIRERFPLENLIFQFNDSLHPEKIHLKYSSPSQTGRGKGRLFHS